MAQTIAILSLLAVACASARSGPRARVGNVPVEVYKAEDGTPAIESKQALPQGGKMVCVMEKPIGSNIAERVCRYQETLDEKARQTQESFLTMPQHSPCGNDKCPTAGANAGVP